MNGNPKPIASAIVVAAAVLGFSYTSATIGPNPVNIAYLLLNFGLCIWAISIVRKNLQ